MNAIRQPAVAGQFYPGREAELSAAVDGYLNGADKGDARVPKAMIAPHAGFVYSGPIAATAYARLAPVRDTIKKVVLLGPCHRVAVQGLALSSADAFATPLGAIPLDKELSAKALALPQVEVFDPTHEMEHSLEVHLLFLQRCLSDFTLVPLVVGQASPESVAEVLDALWGGDETLIVVSSDLSHYLDYASARELDGQTCQAIEAMAPARIARQGACGRFPVGGLLVAAKQRGMSVETVDLRNSGDTAGSKDRVVGYGSWLFFEDGDTPKTAKVVWGKTVRKKAPSGASDGAGAPAVTGESDFGAATKALLDEHGLTLVLLAAVSIDHGLKHGTPVPVDVAEHPTALREPGACFVTLTRGGKLRGCIGSPEAHRPLIADVAANAYRAGFKDPRFPPLAASERQDLHLSISVLSPQTPMKFADEREFMEQLRAGRDGLVIADGPRRALFLPSVWEQLPDPAIFVGRLKQKAGLKPDHWSENFQAWRFVTEFVSIDDLQ